MPPKNLWSFLKLDRDAAPFFNCSALKFLRTIRYGVNRFDHDRY
jgi:hypothetical protein